MDVTFHDQSLDDLETDATYNAGFGDVIVKAYRKAMQHIRAATDERTLYARRSFRFEKLSGNREGQYSLRLNDQWRLIVELHGKSTEKTVHIVEIQIITEATDVYSHSRGSFPSGRVYP